MNLITITLMHGLPASGKSTLTDYMSNSATALLLIDNYLSMDKRMTADKAIAEFIKQHRYIFSETRGRDEHIIVDGLFTTNSDLIKALNLFAGAISDKEMSRTRVVINSFSENREACLWNNMNRDKDAALSIKTLPYESVDLDNIKHNTKFDRISINTRNVVKKNLLLVASESLKKHIGNTIKSENWSGGGYIRDCWGHRYDLYEDNPVVFTELFDILEDLNVSVDIDDVMAKCVDIESDTESDYYGSSVRRCWYECSLIRLEEYLAEKGYLKAWHRKSRIGYFLESDNS
jgi:hypothetical protein